MRSLALIVTAAAAAACTGEIGGDLDDVGGPGSGVNTNSANGPNGPAAPGVSGPCTEVIPDRRVVTLSRSDFDTTVNVILGDTSNVARTTFPPESRGSGFSSDAQSQVVNSNLVSLMMSAAESIAASSLSKELDFVSGNLNCTLAANPSAASVDTCAMKYISARGEALFRRPLTNDETDDLYATYLVGVANPYPNTAATSSGVELVLSTLLQTPGFFYRTELGAPEDMSATVTLTAYEVASEISYLATGGPPDAALLSAAAAGGLSTSDAIAAQYTRLLQTPLGHAHVQQFVLEWLDGDQIKGSDGSPVTPSIAKAMTDESRAFAEEALFNGPGTFRELLTGGYTFANAELASYYGLPPNGLGASASKVSLNASSGRGGVLSQGAFLLASSGQGVPLLHRGNVIRSKFLCESLPSFASLGLENFVPKPLPVPPPGTTTKEALQGMGTSGPCYTCHQFFQPIGYGLEHFDRFGRYQATENGGTIDPSGYLAEARSVDPSSGLILDPKEPTKVTFNDYAGLASTLADSPRANSCFASQVVAFAAGRTVKINECAVRDVQASGSGATGATVTGQLANYVKSNAFVRRTR